MSVNLLFNSFPQPRSLMSQRGGTFLVFKHKVREQDLRKEGSQLNHSFHINLSICPASQ